MFVKDLSQGIVKSIPEIEKYMLFGTNNRKTASTNMNQDSSRSHSIFTIYIETLEEIEERFLGYDLFEMSIMKLSELSIAELKRLMFNLIGLNVAAFDVLPDA